MTQLTETERKVIDDVMDICVSIASNGKDFDIGVQEIKDVITAANIITRHTYDELKPQALIGDEYVIHDTRGDMRYDICKGKDKKACWHCKTETAWYDLDFGAYLCSLECSRAKWLEYGNAVKGNGNDKHNP